MVTGASGFIGANLVRALLAREDEVHILTRPESSHWRLTQIKEKLNFHNCQISDEPTVLKVVENVQPEQVFHLAHYGGNAGEDDSGLINKIIIEGTRVLFNVCAKVNSIRSIVNAGSSSEYGAKQSEMEERMLIEPNTSYGCAKAWATLYGQHLSREKNIPITTLRFFTPFGPWESPPRFIPSIILACLRGAAPQITNPLLVRDFTFIDDVVKACILTADNPYPGEIINISFGCQMTFRKAAEIILKHTGAKVSVETGGIGRSFDQTNAIWQADISKAKNLLGWKPEFSQEEGIIKTIKWFNENQNLY
ncbi:MAG: dTDP-glucose 4,6-dehydratase [Candidatus Yanofskybacteria bacterium GW2011_GWA1_44_21]|nr:MAG: dTDP-glucose 4,6-dehydratase [Candidatus Yanofskybacteria bacterium GW2011_GWA2_44_10]KKT50722.1 MAG: dTDP-glucose 4,6-dehydratase [Candidatus Yanofskybacteria bacterium GW2011_GWA1_44_21]